MVFQTHDMVLQDQLFLFQARDLKLVDNRLGGERANGVVEIAMLNLQLFQLLLIAVVVHAPFYTGCGEQVIVKKTRTGQRDGFRPRPDYNYRQDSSHNS